MRLIVTLLRGLLIVALGTNLGAVIVTLIRQEFSTTLQLLVSTAFLLFALYYWKVKEK